MLNESTERKVIASQDVRGFFEDSIGSTMDRQGVAAQPHTVGYVAGLLTRFSRAERLYERNADGVQTPVLAFLYGRAQEAESPAERCAFMQRLGDVALFLSGVFADSFNRKLVDVDYCIAMGAGAYGYLSEAPATAADSRERVVFGELAVKFARFVDVLNEICECSAGRSNRDLMRLYETWLRTGSPRAASRLRALGIEVSAARSSRAWH